MANKDPVELIAGILVIIGGINWGLVGLLNLNLVEAIFGSFDPLAQIIYVLVGLSALYVAYAMYVKKK
ncbi:MAG: DUF378 domain-containing protein [archaeon]|nr:DUF378 domain-containing protein [archaeon]